MQQIRDLDQNKKAPGLGRFFICNNVMVREVDYRWNQFYPSLMLMYEKLARFGLVITKPPPKK
jgi:hypothetical protein